MLFTEVERLSSELTTRFYSAIHRAEEARAREILACATIKWAWRRFTCRLVRRLHVAAAVVVQRVCRRWLAQQEMFLLVAERYSMERQAYFYIMALRIQNAFRRWSGRPRRRMKGDKVVRDVFVFLRRGGVPPN